MLSLKDTLDAIVTKAVALTTSAGSATQPVYFKDGKPAACSYSLGKSVPSNAVFTDTTYSAATQSAAGLMSAADKKKLDNEYLVGDTLITTSSVTPASRWGGTWELIASDRVLMGASDTHKAGTTVEAGLPNITGYWGDNWQGGSPTYSGAFSGGIWGAVNVRSGSDNSGHYGSFSFNASKSNAIYGNSTTVQPAAYYVYMWHRIS